jgi:polar amino acid transport system substrate-binding protein
MSQRTDKPQLHAEGEPARRRFFKEAAVASGGAAAVLAMPAMAVECPKSALDTVKETGVLRAAVTNEVPYFGFIDEKGNHVGFECDLVAEIAKRLNAKLNMSQVTSATRIPTLQQGRVDLIASTMTHYRSRDAVVDFSIDYFFSPQTLLVKANSGIHNVADMAGKRAGAKNPREFVLLGKEGTYGGGPYGLGVRENDSKWRDAVNFALQDLWVDGTWDKLFNKWVGPNTKLQLTKELLGFEMEVWH